MNTYTDLFRTTGSIIEPCATPAFSPSAGSFDFNVDVTLTCATPSSTIYYTTDGSAPTTSSAVYAAPLHLTANTTVRALATAAGLADSGIASASYVVIANPSCAKPVISVSSSGDPRDVTITCATIGASIYYTIDGSNPTAASNLYSGTFQVQSSKIVKAVALKTLYKRSPYAAWSSTLRFGNSVILGTEYLTITMPDGKEWLAENFAWDGAGQWWNNDSANDGDGRYYLPAEIESAQPSLTGGWHGPLHADLTALYSILTATSPGGEGGLLKSTSLVDWNAPNSGAEDRYGFGLHGHGYCSDGNWQAKKIVGGFGAVGSGAVTWEIWASAYFAGSGVTTNDAATFRQPFRLVREVVEPCATPVITPTSGSYVSSVSVTITCATPGSTIYYTTDGSTPTTSSAVYTSSFELTASTSVKAIATAPGFDQSAMATATYNITVPTTLYSELLRLYDFELGPKDLPSSIESSWNS